MFHFTIQMKMLHVEMQDEGRKEIHKNLIMESEMRKVRVT